MSDPTLSQIHDELQALRARVDALNDPRLDNLSGRLVECLTELRRHTRPGHIERFAR